jgi:hypothetical protein
MRLAKAGYYGGDPVKVLHAPVNVVIDILNYERFESEYEKAFELLNKKDES